MVTMRDYQERIISEAVGINTIVSLPTGAGKTLIAAELILRTAAESWAPGQVCARTLLLVPTRPLVDQQGKAVADWHQQRSINSVVKQYCGGMSLPTAFDILVSTPAAFYAAQMKDHSGELLAWSSWDLIVIDEVHHADPQKDHPYRKLATSLMTAAKRQPDKPMPRVLGLTASLTYASTKIEQSITRLCSKLGVKQIKTASDEELARGGYQATRSPAQTVPQLSIPLGLVPVTDRKPHLMSPVFHHRIENGQATPFTLQLSGVIRSLEQHVSDLDANFKSPLKRKPISQWESYAHNVAKQSTPDARQIISELVHWYGALKLLAISWEEDEFLAIEFLRMTGVAQQYFSDMIVIDEVHNADLQKDHQYRKVATEFFVQGPHQSLRLEQLHQTLLQLHAEIKSEGNQFRGILFVEQRVTTYVLQHFIQRTPALADLFRPVVVYSASSPATPSLSLSAATQAVAMKQFAIGDSNLLICTSTVEEGMDVPASNCVICFDTTPHAVSLVQRRGRGRQAGSKFVALAQLAHRTIRDLEKIEQTQMQVCANFELPELTQDQQQKELEQERTKQMSRERTAGEKLRLQVQKVGTVTAQNVLGMLNIACKQTKVDLTQSAGALEVVLRYESITRSCEGRGQGSGKKAKREAAVALVLMLCEQLGASATEPSAGGMRGGVSQLGTNAVAAQLARQRI